MNTKPKANTKFWCIWSVDENKVMGSGNNLFCYDKSKVIGEVTRIAAENPKSVYIVLEAIGSYVTKLPDVQWSPLECKSLT